MTLDSIIDLARAYARARSDLEDVTDDIRERRRKAVRSRLTALRSRIAETAAAREALTTAITAAPLLFAKPRTQTVDGVKFGYRKKVGAIACDDDAVAEAIRKTFPARYKQLVRTKVQVDKTALRKLPAGDLARLGVTIEDPVDEVAISVAASDVDKLVDALLEDAGDGEAA